MTIEISDRILEKSGLTPAKLRLELAIILFQRESLTLGQASKIAGGTTDLAPEKIMELSKELTAVKDELEAKEMRWMELAEMA